MPPRKPPGSREDKKKANDALRTEVPLNGLYLDRYCAFPVWDAAEIERENWMSNPQEFNANDPSTYYTDPDSAQLGSVLFEGLDGANIEWKRPSVLFSPFKPVVYRQSSLEANPYESHDESEEGKAAREAAQEAYRDLRPLRAVGDEDEATARAAAAKSRVAAATAALSGPGGAAGIPSASGSTHSGTPRHRRGHNAAAHPVPFLMGAFQSALMILSQNQLRVQAGCFAWELIYPQAPNPHNLPLPAVNPSGKYAVRLFFGGAFRKVVIDDRLPADTSGRSILTVTDYKEIWPALLAKAVMKVLGPAFEAQIALNPVVTLATLMCGWTPQVLNPVADELLIYRTLQHIKNQQEDLVLVATCSDSAGRGTSGAVGPDTSKSLQLLSYESALQNKGLNKGSGSGGGDPAASSMGAASHSGDSVASAALEEVLCKDKEGSETFYRTHGLRAFHAYHISDMRPFGAGFLLRLFCPGVNYTGPFSYDSDDWSAELIDGIGFNPAENRNPSEMSKRWNDFWVSWDSFKDFFSSFIVLRYAADKKSYPNFRSFPADVVVPEGVAAALGLNPSQPGIVTVPGGVPVAVPGASGSGVSAAGAPGGSGGTVPASPSAKKTGKRDQNVVTLDIPAAPEVTLAKHQKTATRWVHIKNNDSEYDSHALVVLTGMPCPSSVIQSAVVPPAPIKGTKGGAAAAAAAAAAAGQVSVVVPPAGPADAETEPQRWTVEVHRFDWTQSQPFTLLGRQSCTRGLNQSCNVVLAPGRSTTMRITVENAPVGCAVAVTSPCEISAGTEREVLLEGSGIVFGSDAGSFSEHSGPSNIASGSNGGSGSAQSSPTSSPSASMRGGQHGPKSTIASEEAQAANEQLAVKHTTPGQFSNPAALQSGTIWFKRHLVVKADTTASFILSTLPRDADLAAHRVVPQEVVQQVGKGKKGGGGGSGGQGADTPKQQQQQQHQGSKRGAASSASPTAAAAAAATAEDDENEEGKNEKPEPVRPISDYVNLILVNIETGHTTLDTIGRILNVPLAPNRLGYMLMAVGRTPEHYRPGNWKLYYYSTRVFDAFEPRAFEDVATRTGNYVQNDLRQVFRYNFNFPASSDKNDVGPSVTVQACLRDDSGLPVPFSMELRHSAIDPALASAAAAQSAAASGGASGSAAAAAAAAAAMSSSSGKAASKADQAAAAAAAAAADANGNTGEVVASRTASHYTMLEHVPLSAHEKNTPSYYSLVCVLEGEYSAAWEQRRKAQVIEGFRLATEKQERLLLQHQWTRYQALKRNPGAPLPRELEQPPAPLDVQPGNIVFTVSLHFSNGKYELKEDMSIADALSAVKQGWGRKEAEERAAALAASSGKRAPANKKANAKDEQQMAEAIAAHFARARAAREGFLQNRKGIFLPYLDAKSGQPVLDALSDPSLKYVPLVQPTDYDTYENDPQRAAEAEKTAALSKALSHAAPTAFAKKLVERTVETTAGMRAARKVWISHVNDTLAAHWAEVAPNKPLGGQKDEQEQDDKKKRGTAAGRLRR